MERYARQAVFGPIGKEGQETLLQSKVTIIGMGALGTVAANNLCRAGIGYIRFVDRDYVELTNLQRQILYNEDDATQRLPKVIAAFNHLSRANSEITIEPIIADVNSSNIEGFVNDANLILDATDNFETRFLMNEACHKHKIPWIYCGALGSTGITMNILQKKGTPCFKCLMRDTKPDAPLSCSTVGVLNMITMTMASIQTAEAVKILLGSESIRNEVLSVDLWNNDIDLFELQKNEDCPVCVHAEYEFLGKIMGSYTTSLCGSNTIQVVPSQPISVDFQAFAEKLRQIGDVQLSQYALKFSDNKYEITLFGDGRALIKNALDGNNAKSVYTEYIGL